MKNLDIDDIDLEVKILSSFHTTQLCKDGGNAVFSSELWEYIFVTGGEFQVNCGGKIFTVHEKELFLYKPSRDILIYTEPGKMADLYIVDFFSASPFVSIFNNKIFSIDNEAYHQLINALYLVGAGSEVRKYKKNFSVLQRFTEGLIKQHCIMSLADIHYEDGVMGDPVLNQNVSEDLISKVSLSENYLVYIIIIIELMKSNLYNKLTVNDICSLTYYSRSHIYAVFKGKTGESITTYFTKLKIEEAKLLIV